MKNFFVTILIGSVLLISFLASITGVVLISKSMINGTPLMEGFQVFALGIIMFTVLLSGYMISKILSYTELISDTLTNLLEHTLKDTKNPSFNPMEALFGPGGLPGSGTIKMARMEEDGTITPYFEKEFNNQEEFIKHRNELLSKALGNQPDGSKKKVEDMSLDELKEEEKKAVSSQDFELAACIRDAIDEKTKQK